MISKKDFWKMSDQDFVLNRIWSLWIDMPNFHSCYEDTKNDVWMQNIKKIYTIDTIKKFWAVYNNIHLISNVSYKCLYYLTIDAPYKKNDEKNDDKKLNFVTLKNNTKKIDIIWEQCLLTIIGEDNEYSNYIHCISIENCKFCYNICILLSTNDEDIKKSIFYLFNEIISNNQF